MPIYCAKALELIGREINDYDYPVKVLSAKITKDNVLLNIGHFVLNEENIYYDIDCKLDMVPI